MRRSLLAVALAAAVFAAGPVAAAEPAAGPPAPGIGFKSQPPEEGSLALRVAGALALVGVLGAAMIYAIRKLAPWAALPMSRSGSAALRVVESLRLTQKLTLFVVEFDTRRVLLALTDRGVTVVSEVPPGGPRPGTLS